MLTSHSGLSVPTTHPPGSPRSVLLCARRLDRPLHDSDASHEVLRHGLGMERDSGQIPIDDEYIAGGFEQASCNDASTISSSRTLATTTTMYRHENGRTYHAYRDGEYWGPNDAKQNNHEGIVHHICLLTLQDKLYLAPITPGPRHILDLGTGSGIWAIDMADRFPDANVVGTDLSPVPPGMRPDNCHFEVDDCCSPWVYPVDHFDFIHMRGLFGSIADWPELYRQCYDHLQPGGWVEQIEFSVHMRAANGTLSPNAALARWSKIGVQLGEMTGKTFEIAENMAGLMHEGGFQHVVEKRFKWPVGPWSSDAKLKEIGRWNLLNWEEGMEGWCMALYTRYLGMSQREVHDWLGEVRKALRDRKQNTYHEVRVVYAQKPHHA